MGEQVEAQGRGKVDGVTLCTRLSKAYLLCANGRGQPYAGSATHLPLPAAIQSPTPKGVSIDSRVLPTISNQGYLMHCNTRVDALSTTHLPDTTPAANKRTPAALTVLRDA